jgi:hypothetical protein
MIARMSRELTDPAERPTMEEVVERLSDMHSIEVRTCRPSLTFSYPSLTFQYPSLSFFIPMASFLIPIAYVLIPIASALIPCSAERVG